MRCCGGWTRSGGCQSHTLCPTPTSTAAARRTGQGAPAPQTCAPRTCAPHPPVSPAQGLRAGGGSGHVASKRYSPSIATPHTCAPHTLSCTHKCMRCKTVGVSALEDIRAHQCAPPHTPHTLSTPTGEPVARQGAGQGTPVLHTPHFIHTHQCARFKTGGRSGHVARRR